LLNGPAAGIHGMPCPYSRRHLVFELSIPMAGRRSFQGRRATLRLKLLRIAVRGHAHIHGTIELLRDREAQPLRDEPGQGLIHLLE
jgi:hypothetical protein